MATIIGRKALTVEDFDALSDLNAHRAFGVRETVVDPEPYAAVFESEFEGRSLLVLDRIVNFHREYRWS